MKHLFLLFGFLLAAFTAQAAKTTQQGVKPVDGNELLYNLFDDGTAQVSNIGTCGNKVDIPAKITHEGKTWNVTGINNSAFSGNSITSVSGGENITSIGVSAFQACSHLTSIGNLLDKVTNIPSKAFYNCTALTGKITLNAAITNIGESAFYNCTNPDLSLRLTNLTNATIGYRAFYNCTGLNSIGGTAASIGEEAFYGCTNLTSIGNLLDKVTNIPSKAFYNCTALTGKITLNAAITNIGESAFYNCTNRDLSLSFTNLTNATIGESAFSNNGYNDCTGLKSIAGTAKSIGEYAFDKCNNLTSIGNLLDNVTDIPNYAFYRCSSLTGEITLNAGINNIGDYAFNESRISNIYCLAAKPPTLGEDALCDNALSVKVPKSAVDAYQSWETSYSMTISAGDPTSVTTAANSGSTTHWATFSNTYSDSELSVEAGKTLTLYNATVADGKLTLTERTGSSVAKGEAVLVKTDAVTVSVTPLSTTSLVKAEDNDLLATPEYATILHTQDGCKYYRLTYNDVESNTGLGFYLGVATVDGVKKTDGTYLNASPYKAYLKVTVEAATEPSTAKLARGFAFPGDDETTGIECITVTDESLHRNGNAEGIFDLQGRKVSKPTKGVYINNGKKVIIK